jgi:hypothetical protein
MRNHLTLILAILIFGSISCEPDAVLHSDKEVLGNPVIDSFQPQSAKPGTVVTITGNNFGDKPVIISLKVGSLTAKILNRSMNEITFEVPDTILTSAGKISVWINGLKATSLTDFKILTPWSVKTGYPGKNDYYYALKTFSVNGKAYVMEPDNPQNAIWEYNLSTDNWSRKSNLATGFLAAETSFVIGNSAYTGLGIFKDANTNFNLLLNYQPDSDTWTRKADYPGETKLDALGFQVGGKGYVAGGMTDTAPYQKQVWEYDPANDSWTRKKDIPLFLTAVFQSTDSAYLTDHDGNIYSYLPDTDTLVKISSIENYNYFSGFLFDGTIYLMDSADSPKGWKFHISDRSWSRWETNSPITGNHDCISSGNYGLVIDRANISRLYVFDPSVQ